jgi:hypothetical protein
MSVIIAVDGPAASGKGTISRRLAKHFHFAHMDSGALYRLTALAVQEANGDPTLEADALSGAATIDLSRAGDPAIRTGEIGVAASKVSAIPAVRAALHDYQLAFITNPPGESSAPSSPPMPRPSCSSKPVRKSGPTAAGWNFRGWASKRTRSCCWPKSWPGTRPIGPGPSRPCAGPRTPPCSTPPIWI